MYLTVLCDFSYLVSLLFAVLLSLHLVTFLMFFIACRIHNHVCSYNLPRWDVEYRNLGCTPRLVLLYQQHLLHIYIQVELGLFPKIVSYTWSKVNFCVNCVAVNE